MALTATPSARPQFLLAASESIGGNGIIGQVLKHEAFEIEAFHLNATTVPPLTVLSIQTYALVGGTKTIDLQALATTINSAHDCSGKKVQAIRVTNLAGNAALTVSGEGANGYSLGGALVVPAASGAKDVIAILYAPEALADVASGDRYLVVTGTGTQSFRLELLIG